MTYGAPVEREIDLCDTCYGAFKNFILVVDQEAEVR
jgi:hypothetical protein